MTPTIRMNFQSDAKFTRDLWACPGRLTENDKVGYRDIQFHVTICSAYAHQSKTRPRIKYFTRQASDTGAAGPSPDTN